MRHNEDEDEKIPRAILLLIEDEVKKQLKEQQTWQRDEIHSLKCMHEESIKTQREEIRALEVKVASLVRAARRNNTTSTNEEQEEDEQSAVLSLSIPKRSGRGSGKGDGDDDGDDDEFNSDPIVRDACPPLRDDYFNNHDAELLVVGTKDAKDDSSTASPTQSIATGIMKSLQSIFQTDDKAGDDDDLIMDVKANDTPALYLNDDQEAQMGTRKDAASRLGLRKIPSRTSITLSGEKKRDASGITNRGLNSSSLTVDVDTQSLPQARKDVEGFQLHPTRFQEQEGDTGMRCFSKYVTMPKRKPRRKFMKRFIFSVIPVPTSKNRSGANTRDHEDGLELEEDTFTLMMLNKTYSVYRLPHHVNKIMTNCFRVILIAFFGIYWGIWSLLKLIFTLFHQFFWPDLLLIGMELAICLFAIFGSRRISLLFSRILRTMLTPLSGPWFLGIVTFGIFQLTLGISIIVDQWSVCTENISTDESCTPFDIPMHVGLGVNVAQCVTVVLVLATQTDILSSIKTVYILRNMDHIPWDRVIGEEGDRTWDLWLRRILLPNVLKFIQAVVVLFASFIIIVQSTKTLDLLKDFTALLAVSDADNIMFYLADMGYLGEYLKSKTEEVKSVADRWSRAKSEGQRIVQGGETEVKGNESKAKATEEGEGGENVVTRSIVLKSRFGNFNPNYLVSMFSVLCGTMIAGLSYCMNGQWNGRWMSAKYPDCKVRNPRWIGDGKCDHHAPYFSVECGWDGGDCPVNVLEGYTNCTVAYPKKIGDGQCDKYLPYYSEECGYDGDDCVVEGYPNCKVAVPNRIGDGKCHDRPPYNTLECGYDGGDCGVPIAVDEYSGCFVRYTSLIGNEKCNDYPPYNTPECGYDGGDCIRIKEEKNVRGYSNCLVHSPNSVGDNSCRDYPPYNTLECEYDGGDCVPKSLNELPDCFEFFMKDHDRGEGIGNRYCP